MLPSDTDLFKLAVKAQTFADMLNTFLRNIKVYATLKTIETI